MLCPSAVFLVYQNDEELTHFIADLDALLIWICDSDSEKILWSLRGGTIVLLQQTSYNILQQITK